jgi:hypothetical protein
MDNLANVLKSREREIEKAWLVALEKIKGMPFGKTHIDDLAEEIRSAFHALLAIVDRNDASVAEAMAARLVRLPAMRGSAVNDTIRGLYAVFEPLRPILDSEYGKATAKEELAKAVAQLRGAVTTMGSLISQENLKYGMERQNEWDRLAFFGIKGPLTVLIADLEAMKAGAEKLPEGFRTILHSSHTISQRLMYTIENLFIMHRLGEGLMPLRREVIPVSAALRSILEDVQRRARTEKKGIELKPGTGNAAFLGDAMLLGRVLGLALNKALDDTPPGGVVKIETSDEGDSIRLRVAFTFSSDTASKGAEVEAIEFGFCRIAVVHMGGMIEIGGTDPVVIDMMLPGAPASALPARDAAARKVAGDSAGSPDAPDRPDIKIVRDQGGAPSFDDPNLPGENTARGNITIVRSIAPQDETKDKIEK